jgi:hypothetical protein
MVERPDQSEKAIARRRALRAMALADSALDNRYPDPDAAHIHEKWVLGEITSAECIALLDEFFRSAFLDR